MSNFQKLDIDKLEQLELTAEQKEKEERQIKVADYLNDSQDLLKSLMLVLASKKAGQKMAYSVLTAARELYASVPYRLQD